MKKDFQLPSFLFLLSRKHLSANNLLNEKDLSTNIAIFLTESSYFQNVIIIKWLLIINYWKVNITNYKYIIFEWDLIKIMPNSFSFVDKQQYVHSALIVVKCKYLILLASWGFPKENYRNCNWNFKEYESLQQTQIF